LRALSGIFCYPGELLSSGVEYEHIEHARAPHTRIEERALAWGSEFTTKAATLQRDSAEFVPEHCVMGLGPVVARVRDLVHEVLDLGAQVATRGCARCAPQLLDRGAQFDTRGATQVQSRY
jgi:hypothetical protein